MVKQVFSHYENWEDYKNGMYSIADISDKHKKVIGAINLLTNDIEFYNACKELIEKWPVSASVNLTNLQQNRRAWLGAAASCYVHNTTEVLTRIAWNLLNKDEQERANKIADKVIFEYEKQQKTTTYYAKTLFE